MSRPGPHRRAQIYPGSVWIATDAAHAAYWSWTTAPVVFFVQCVEQGTAGDRRARWVVGTLRTEFYDRHQGFSIGRFAERFRAATDEEAAAAWRGRLPVVDLGRPSRLRTEAEWVRWPSSSHPPKPPYRRRRAW